MTSPSTTSPAEISKGRESRRFKDTGGYNEWEEQYRPGGLHPVNFGDTFHDGAYRVIRKLGNGSFSTVWLAINTQASRYVALKIINAKDSTTTIELTIFNHLSKQASLDPRSQHLIFPLDTFMHEGPNGIHRCLVFEPMGATARSLAETLPMNIATHVQRYPKWTAKRILLHALRGLAFLHANGVVHSDVQPGNMLFSIGELSAINEDELKQGPKHSIALERLDGKVDRWAPKCMYHQQSLHDHVKTDSSSLEVKLSDLGAAFWEAEPPSSTFTPLNLRSPELILNRRPYSSAIDIWSFGCLIYEFLTGMTLFSIMTGMNDQESDDEHLLQLYDVLEPLPDDLLAAWPRASRWLGPERQRLRPEDTIGKDNDGEPIFDDPLEAQFKEYKPDEIDEEEAAVVCALIRRTLAFDPAKRPTAAELLDHPWLLE